MLNTITENENTSFANISIPFLCCEHDLRKGIEILTKACVFIFHCNIQHDEASG